MSEDLFLVFIILKFPAPPPPPPPPPFQNPAYATVFHLPTNHLLTDIWHFNGFALISYHCKHGNGKAKRKVQQQLSLPSLYLVSLCWWLVWYCGIKLHRRIPLIFEYHTISSSLQEKKNMKVLLLFWMCWLQALQKDRYKQQSSENQLIPADTYLFPPTIHFNKNLAFPEIFSPELRT